ncbi:fascin domain-containing protein [Streptomyces geranii]|uniref:fascin domain-containing protein n=1 Tax=Streptomyces geranii TaxID=2058923 RepID=UPI000D023415|nr:hypothetical protein [Streptomyces geranii]
MRKLISLALSVTSLLGLTALGSTSANAADVSASAVTCGHSIDASYITIRSARTGNYVSAELDYEDGNYGMLRARAASSNGSWEKFQVWENTTTDQVAFRNLGNSRFVAAEIDTSGENQAMLRARSTTITGSWEKFDACYDQDTKSWSFRSVANGRFVSAEADYTGYNANVLRARSSAVSGSWERFYLYAASPTSAATTLSTTKLTPVDAGSPS